jgi:NAD+ kinase
MKIAIYGRRNQGEFVPRLATLLESLSPLVDSIEMHEKLYNYLFGEMGLHPLRNLRRVYETTRVEADLIVSIGGDGTFLRTVAWAGESGSPILGINTGNLGYLSPMTLDRAIEVVGEMSALGDRDAMEARAREIFHIDRRSLLEVVNPDVRGSRYALNEVTISKDEGSSVVTADTYINGKHLARYVADGLIIATPTGSTAYNLSVGGPIIEPSARVSVISPIAAHALGLRPLVISDESRIDVEVGGRARSFRLCLDGRPTTVPIDTRVTIRRAPFTIAVVEAAGDEFPAMLTKKLFF